MKGWVGAPSSTMGLTFALCTVFPLLDPLPWSHLVTPSIILVSTCMLLLHEVP